MSSIRLGDKTFIEYIPEIKIRESVKRLADRINRDFQGQRPIFLVVLNGAFVFASDLVRGISTECDVSFVKLASYEGTASTGKVKELVGLNENLEERNVIVVEDIIDSGNTIEHILHQLNKMNAASISVASLLLKPDVFKKDFSIQYIGMEIPNDFIVGYGLDYNG